MSALGQKQKSGSSMVISALPLKADMEADFANVG